MSRLHREKYRSGMKRGPFEWPVRADELSMYEEALKKLEEETGNIETLYIGEGVGAAPHALRQRNNNVHNLSAFWSIVNEMKRKKE